MSVRFFEVGPWSIAVESDLPAIHNALALNFQSSPTSSQAVLTCRIVSDPGAYWEIAKEVVLDGPQVPVSPGVMIHYGFRAPKTWLEVTHTGIVELDASKSAQCRVWLHPEAVAAYVQGAFDPDKRTACPEAFFYPMLAEWVRGAGACLVHCGAVAVNGRAIFLAGPSGSGKSTQVLRMLTRGASFVADDLALLGRETGGLRLMRFREVANLDKDAAEVFPELSHLRDAPIRGDGKYCISITKWFPGSAVTQTGPGVVLRLHPRERPSFEPVPPGEVLDGMHSMAWFGSRPESNQAHFRLLTDWLFDCPQWYVSRAYIRDSLEQLMEQVGPAAGIGGRV